MGQTSEKQGSSKRTDSVPAQTASAPTGNLTDLVRLLARLAARDFIASLQEPLADAINDDQVE